MKRLKQAILLVALLSMAGMTKCFAYDYDFSAVCSSGQTLYYRITNNDSHEVQLTYPRYYTYIIEVTSNIVYRHYTYWYNYEQPVGDVVIPSNVQYNGETWSVTSIRDHAFGDSRENTGGQYGVYYHPCTQITSVVIPSSVTSIENHAFAKCSGLTDLTILAETPPALGGSNVFYNVNKSIPVIVPCGSVESYQNTSIWNEFTNWQCIIETVNHTVNATPNPVEGGIITGSGTYEEGQACTLTATANEGYTFFNWTEDGEEVSTEATYSFTVTGNRNLVANFTLQGSAPTGAINGLFSVGENTQVYFSQGNLQYKASTNTWRFAENQWDYVGEDNSNVSETNEGWIDLFGWGTSGWNSGANCYQPWNTGTTNSDYYPGGTFTNDLTGDNAYADWGVNNGISNGGNMAGQWHTLNKDEWEYVFNTRSTPSGIRYAKAQVNGTNGLILLPDNWNDSIFNFNNANNMGAIFSSNVIGVMDWMDLESAGAVFLPAAGNRNGASVYDAGEFGFYWSTSSYNANYAYSMYFYNSYLNPLNLGNRCFGLSVRLVRSFYDISVISSPAEGGMTTGGGTLLEGSTCTLTASSNEGYAFINWTKDGVEVSNSEIYSFMVTGNDTLVANFEKGVEVIGYGTTTNVYLPSYSYYKQSLSQQIYTAEEIGREGIINSVAFYNAGATKTRSYDIYMVSTEKVEFESSSDWIAVTESDLVYSGEFEMNADTWTVFQFDAPFHYDGVSNIALVVDDNTGNWTDSPHMACRVFDADGNQAIRVYGDNNNYDPYNPTGYTGTLLTVKNQIKLGITPTFHFITEGGWSESSNWQGGMLPGDTDVVFIDAPCQLDQNATVDALTVTEGQSLTLQSGKTLIVTNTLMNAATTGLVIEDGAQLMHASDNVSATVKKNIVGHGTIKGKYYLISNPLVSIVNPEQANIYHLTRGNYDLYDWLAGSADSLEWRNFKDFSFMMHPEGYGYLYANQDGVELLFPGVIRRSDIGFGKPVSCVADEVFHFNGWNLIGNPFVCDAYLVNKDNEPLPFYRINAAGNDFEADTLGVIAPMESVFYIASENDTVYFVRTDHTSMMPYTISVSANPTEDGTVSGGGIYIEGQSCTVTAIANSGYIFSNWTENDSVVSTQAGYQFIVTNNRTLVANFTIPPTYTIGVSVNPTNSGTVSGGGTYIEGQSCTVTAIANSGYIFSNWTENDSVVSNNAVYSFTVMCNRNLVAHFQVRPSAPTGSIDGMFTVNANGDKVYFSQGNLQYRASSNTWRFATHQYDYVGSSNSSISQTYSGWIDLFGWGTSGWNCGNTYYHPWDSNNSNSSLYGPPDNNNLSGSYANSDWGRYNAISNGGNQTGQWCTLTSFEWRYVFATRTTPSGIRFAKAQVAGVNGVILLPDDWSVSIYSLSSTNTYTASFSSNVVSATQWATLENAGAVFLPAAGCRSGTSVGNVGSYGYYWSASHEGSIGADNVNFRDNRISTYGGLDRYWGFSVRLIRPCQ